MSDLMDSIKKAKAEMLEMGIEPAKIRMSADMYRRLIREIERYFNCFIPKECENVILDQDGKPLPMCELYGLPVYLDKKLLSWNVIIEKKSED